MGKISKEVKGAEIKSVFLGYKNFLGYKLLYMYVYIYIYIYIKHALVYINLELKGMVWGRIIHVGVSVYSHPVKSWC